MAQFNPTSGPSGNDEGYTAVGNSYPGPSKNHGRLHVKMPVTPGTSTGLPDYPSCLMLDGVTDTTGAVITYWLWVDSAGKLRIHTAAPTNQDSDGTIVGAQTA